MFEEYKQIEESYRKELKERNKEREAWEAKIVSLWKEVENGKTLQNYESISKALERTCQQSMIV